MSNHAPFVPWMHSLLDRMKELYNKPNARTIAEALPDITGALHYRGTKATVADLPSSGNATGDVWHITADGSEWAWDGSEWENLGGAVAAVAVNVDTTQAEWSGATWESVKKAAQNGQAVTLNIDDDGARAALLGYDAEADAVDGEIVETETTTEISYSGQPVTGSLTERDPGSVTIREISLKSSGGAVVTNYALVQTDELSSYDLRPIVVTVSGTTPTITPINNRIYNCGEVASLTISNPPATGAYSVVFTSGATATDLSIPQTLLMPDGFTVAANTLYEINVLDDRAVIGSWAVSA